MQGVPDVKVDYTPIHHAVSVLAAACDWAGTYDAQGFNKADTWLGHAAAEIPPSEWDDVMAVAFRGMIRKYRKQLEQHGIDWDTLPIPPGGTNLDGLSQEVRDRARARINDIREVQRRAKQNWIACDGEGQDVRISFAYSPVLVGEVKASITGRRWNPTAKVWSAPFGSLPKAVEFADKHELAVPAEVRAMVPIAQNYVGATMVTGIKANEARPNVFLDDKGKLCVAADFDQALNEALKDTNYGRSCWSKERHLHEVPLRRPFRLREIIEQFHLTVSEGAREAIENEAVRQEFNRIVSSQATMPGVPMPAFPGLAPDQQVKDVQWVPIWWALQFKRVILGDEMGFGKTLQALAVLSAASAFPAVVVCRASLVDNWCDEIEKFFPYWNVFKAEGQEAQIIPGDTDVIVIGSNNLGYTPPVPTWDATKDAAALRKKPLELIKADRAQRAITYLLTQDGYDTLEKITSASARTMANNQQASTNIKVTSALLGAIGTQAAALLLTAMQWSRLTLDAVKAIDAGTRTMTTRRMEAALVAVARHASKRHGATKEFKWVDAVNRLNPKALIIDEGQDVKEITANRTQAVSLVAELIREIDGYILNLSGTSILNYVRELGAQLEMMGLIHLFGGIKKFLWRYCVDPKEKEKYHEYGPKYTGRDNEEELFEILRGEGVMVRRTDPEILGLPEFRSETIELSIDDLNPAALASYRQAEADVVGFLAQRARKLAEKLSKESGTEVNPDDAAVEAALKAEGAQHLVLLNTLRTELGKAKRDYAMKWIAAQVEAGEKVVVAADRREEVTAYCKAFGGLRLQGGQSSAAKSADKKRFNTDPDAKVISIAIKAGGTGHTLHADGACNRLLQVELTWGPGDEDQLAKRIHRIGQTRACVVYRLVARGDDDTPLIDDYLDTMIGSKRATLRAVLDGEFAIDRDEVEVETSAVGAVAWEYALRGVHNNVGGRA